jgi:agmatine/peptidylarginine deiminase
MLQQNINVIVDVTLAVFVRVLVLVLPDRLLVLVGSVSVVVGAGSIHI